MTSQQDQTRRVPYPQPGPRPSEDRLSRILDELLVLLVLATIESRSYTGLPTEWRGQ